MNELKVHNTDKEWKKNVVEPSAEFAPSVKMVKAKMIDLNPNRELQGCMLCLNCIALE